MRPGASIVEVVGAFAVLGACLPALFAATGLAAALAREAALLEGAGALAETVADSVLQAPVARSGTLVRGSYEVEVGVVEAGGLARVEIAVRYAVRGEPRGEVVLGAFHVPPLPRLEAR